MIVKTDKEIYRMNRKQYRETIRKAKASVPYGIYAVIKNNMCVLKAYQFNNSIDLREKVTQLQENGYEVLYNGRIQSI